MILGRLLVRTYHWTMRTKGRFIAEGGYQSISELIYNISDNSYSLDNRLILVNRSFKGRALAPRCRLVYLLGH